MSVRIITRQQQQAFQSRKLRLALAVYFSTGVFPALPHFPVLQVSSATITDKTLFISHQKAHHA